MTKPIVITEGKTRGNIKSSNSNAQQRKPCKPPHGIKSIPRISSQLCEKE